MTTDIYKNVNFNAGQEVRMQDLDDAQNFLASRLTDQVLERLIPNMGTLDGVATAALTVTVATGVGPGAAYVTYTRSAGSFLTDNLTTGMIVRWSGFVNAGNNVEVVVMSLTATILTTYATTQVNEVRVGATATQDIAEVEFASQMGTDASQSWAYALTPGGASMRKGSTNAKVLITPGTVFQKIGASAGNNLTLLPFTFDGTLEVSIANGDVSHPRVDLIQMQLSLVPDDLQTRITENNPVTAFLNLGAHTTHVNTIVQAKVAGRSGNNVSIAFVKRTSGSGVTYSENGNAVSIQYEDGVSTVALVEAAIVANATVIEIQSAGTPGNVLANPGDTLAATHLAGGVDSIFSSPSVDMKNRVQCTVSIVTGVAATNPQYPTPTAGYVPLAAIQIPTGYAGGTPVVYDEEDGAGYTTNPILHDLRIPLRVRAYTVYPSDFWYESGFWSLTNTVPGARRTITSTATGVGSQLSIECPVRIGRLLAIGVVSNAATIPTAYLTSVYDSGQFNDGCDVTMLMSATLLAVKAPRSILEVPTTFGPKTFGNGIHSPPRWCNGLRAPKEASRLAATSLGGSSLVLNIPNIAAGTPTIGPVTFYVAEGL